MAVVIGQGTRILGTFFSGVCAVSAQWSTNPNTQRMYCLGSIDAFRSVSKPTQTLSVTVYSEGGSGVAEIAIPPSETCEDSIYVQAGVSPAVCGSTIGDILYSDFVVQQFQFSKEEAQSIGQETWSLQRWMTAADTGNSDVVAPNNIIRGVPEGQATTPYDYLGIEFVTGTTTLGTQGSVQGGSTGKYYENVSGQVSNIGGVSATSGQTGNSSASIPLIPLWL